MAIRGTGIISEIISMKKVVLIISGFVLFVSVGDFCFAGDIIEGCWVNVDEKNLQNYRVGNILVPDVS
jgi:hypothetical protein